MSLDLVVAFRRWPSLAKTCKGLILLLKTLLHLMEFNPNFTYMLLSATAKDNVYHTDLQYLFKTLFNMVNI
jgi:hypothetical protein